MRLSRLLGSKRREFPGTVDYWERRYAEGGNSGAGSYGRLAEWKAEVLNEFVASHEVQSVIELGCGDGNQLTLAKYPRYAGLDISATVIRQCIARFVNDPTKSFFTSSPDTLHDPAGFLRADLAISLDVIFHLVEDAVYEAYMASLFRAAERFVIVYCSNEDRFTDKHVRHHKFTDWVASNRTDWRHANVVKNPYPFDPQDEHNTSFSDFHFFERVA